MEKIYSLEKKTNAPFFGWGKCWGGGAQLGGGNGAASFNERLKKEGFEREVSSYV